MDRENPDGSTTRTAQEAENDRFDSVVLRRTQEEEAWKVAQLAAVLLAGSWAGNDEVYACADALATARNLLAEARRHIAAAE